MIDTLLNIVILLGVLTVLVLLHELGHFVAARRAGVKVHEFGIGFPPRARVLFVRGDTTYTLNWLPIGGFVRLEGEVTSPAEEPVRGPYPDVPSADDVERIEPTELLDPAPRYVDDIVERETDDGDDVEIADPDPRAFVNQSLGTRLRILFAGVAVNFILAWVVFTVIALVAQPIWQVRLAEVMPDSPAARAGLVGGEYIETRTLEVTDEGGASTGEAIDYDVFDDSGDLILAIDGQSFPVFEDMARADAASSGRIAPIQYLADRPSETVTLTIEHADGSVEDVEVTLRTAAQIEAGEGALGFRPGQTQFGQQQNGLVDSVAVGLQMTVETSTLILRAVGNIFVGFFSGSGEGLDDVAGPVGMVGVIGDVRTALPPVFMLWFIGLISANLAVINLLPIPPLDGSRMLMAVVQAASGNRVSPATERLVYFSGWVALMVFLVVVTLSDIQSLVD